MRGENKIVQKIVVDTNVLVSAYFSNTGTSNALVGLVAEGKIEGYTSIKLMEEFKNVIQRDFEVSLERAEQMVDITLQFFKLVEPNTRLKVISDEADNRVLECADYCKANYITSWDPHLTNLGEFNGIKIMNPGKLLEELKKVHRID